MRDFEKNPYTKDEAKVAKFLSNRGVGGGDDPIGFILVSYAFLITQRNSLLQVVNSRPKGFDWPSFCVGGAVGAVLLGVLSVAHEILAK